MNCLQISLYWASLEKGPPPHWGICLIDLCIWRQTVRAWSS